MTSSAAAEAVKRGSPGAVDLFHPPRERSLGGASCRGNRVAAPALAGRTGTPRAGQVRPDRAIGRARLDDLERHQPLAPTCRAGRARRPRRASRKIRPLLCMEDAEPVGGVARELVRVGDLCVAACGHRARRLPRRAGCNQEIHPGEAGRRRRRRGPHRHERHVEHPTVRAVLSAGERPGRSRRRAGHSVGGQGSPGHAWRIATITHRLDYHPIEPGRRVARGNWIGRHRRAGTAARRCRG